MISNLFISALLTLNNILLFSCNELIINNFYVCLTNFYRNIIFINYNNIEYLYFNYFII